MGRFLTLATAGAGGDLQPLVALGVGLRERGHEVVHAGDGSVGAALSPLGVETAVLPPEHDLGPLLVSLIRSAQGLDPSTQGEIVRGGMAAWAATLAPVVVGLVERHRPDALLTSLFGVDVVDRATTGNGLPWGVVNSTFYVGPGAPRDLEADFAPRAVPLIRSFLPALDRATLVLHATDPEFDLGFDGLPPRHHHVGSLIWEAPAPVPAYLAEAGDPWILVTLSSQAQDDLPLARVALDALGGRPVRTVATLGPVHAPEDVGAVPANAFLERYVPHAEVLRRARMLLSHAGHGSVMKALWFGVPMVLVPWGRDQPGVAFRAERLGTAKIVPREGLTDEVLRSAIDEVLDDPSYADRAGEVSERMRSEDPVATACDLAESLLAGR